MSWVPGLAAVSLFQHLTISHSSSKCQDIPGHHRAANGSRVRLKATVKLLNKEHWKTFIQIYCVVTSKGSTGQSLTMPMLTQHQWSTLQTTMTMILIWKYFFNVRLKSTIKNMMYMFLPFLMAWHYADNFFFSSNYKIGIRIMLPLVVIIVIVTPHLLEICLPQAHWKHLQPHDKKH